jgi:outer membrane protein TolC
MRWIYKVVLVTLAPALFVGLAAADDGAPTLTLEQAIALAIEQNHELGAADAGVREADARIEEARSGHLPKIRLDAAFSRTTNPTLVFSNKLNQEAIRIEDFDPALLNDPDALNNFQGNLSIYQPIYRGGSTRAGIDTAIAGREAVASSRERTRQAVVQQVIGAYTDAIVTRNQLDVAHDSLETAQANVRLVSDLHEAGLVVESDLLQARVRETEVREFVAAAESAVEIARAGLNLALGRDLGTPFSLPHQIEIALDNERPLEELVRSAVDQRPDLKAGEQYVRASEMGIRSAQSGKRPELGATGMADANAEQLFDNYGTNWSVFVGARFTVFDGKQTHARVRQATERASRARREQQALTQSVALEVQQAFYDRRTASKRLEQTAVAIDMARASLRIVQDRYAEGLTTLLELLESENLLTQARTRDLAARRDVLLAQARLDLAVGEL